MHRCSTKPLPAVTPARLETPRRHSRHFLARATGICRARGPRRLLGKSYILFRRLPR